MLTLRFILVALLVVTANLQYRLWFGDQNLQSTWRLQNEFEHLNQENQRLDEKNRRFESRIQLLHNNDLGMIETLARRNLGMIREGETYYYPIGSEVLDAQKN